MFIEYNIKILKKYSPLLILNKLKKEDSIFS